MQHNRETESEETSLHQLQGQQDGLVLGLGTRLSFADHGDVLADSPMSHQGGVSVDSGDDSTPNDFALRGYVDFSGIQADVDYSVACEMEQQRLTNIMQAQQHITGTSAPSKSPLSGSLGNQLRSEEAQGGTVSNLEEEASKESGAQQTCRFCYGEEQPMIQPCNCKGSMAYVHSHCLGKWLETRPSLRCDICNYNIQQTLEMKRMRQILRDLLKLLAKRLTKEKFLLLKMVIYSAYIVLSCKKAVACYRLLMQQLRKNYYSKGSNQLSQTILCVAYLLLIVVQLTVFTTEEIRYFYRVLRQHMRLVCYQITFQDKTKQHRQQKQKEDRLRSPNVKDKVQNKVKEKLRQIPSHKSGLADGGTQGLLKRKKEGRSGLFQMQIYDEEAKMESAAAAQQVINKQFREDQLRFQNNRD